MKIQDSAPSRAAQPVAVSAKPAAPAPAVAAPAVAKPMADRYAAAPAPAAKPVSADAQLAAKEKIRGERSAALAPSAKPAESVRTTDQLNVRTSPETGAANKIGTFARDTRLEVVPDASGKTRSGDWIHVRGELPGGKPAEGWVNSQWTKPEGGVAPAPGPIQPTPPSPAAGAPTGERPLTTTDLNVRSTPEQKRDGSNKLGTFAPGTQLEVVSAANGKTREGDWVHVQGKLPGGATAQGWVMSQYLEPEKLRTTDHLNVRSGPDASAGKLSTFPPNTRLQVTPDASGKAREGDWIHVRGEQGGKPIDGWVNKEYVVSTQGNVQGPGGVAQGDITEKARQAIVFAEAQMDPKTGTAVNRNNGLSVSKDPAAWNSWCLAFVSAAYGSKEPLLSAEDAIHSYAKFNNSGRIVPSRELPAGAPIFFEATKHNGGYGHIAVATGRVDAQGEPTIYTSGWKNYDGIHEVSLSWMERMTGAYLGYGLVS